MKTIIVNTWHARRPKYNKPHFCNLIVLHPLVNILPNSYFAVSCYVMSAMAKEVWVTIVSSNHGPTGIKSIVMISENNVNLR